MPWSRSCNNDDWLSDKENNMQLEEYFDFQQMEIPPLGGWWRRSASRAPELTSILSLSRICAETLLRGFFTGIVIP